MPSHTAAPREPYLLVDIGTAFVSAGLVSLGKRSVPELSHVERIPIGSGAETTREVLLQSTEEAVKTLLEKYAKEHVKRVRVVVTSPWHHSNIKTIVQKIDKQATISEKTVLNALERYRAEKPPEQNNVDAESLAVVVKVNGYNTALSRPVLGSTLEINYYESELVASFAERVTALVLRAFPHARSSFHTFPLVASVALRAISEETSFAVVDIAGETTEVAILYEDALHHLTSFPTGYYTIARGLKEGSSAAPGDQLARMALYARNELSPEEQKNFEPLFSSAFASWHEDFNEAMKHASNAVPLPKTLFLMSDREQLGWLKRGIEHASTYQFHVAPLAAPLVQPHIEITETGSYDVFLSLGAVFFHTYKHTLIGEQ